MRVGRDENGRLVVTDLYLHGGKITTETLHEISMARIEAALNAPEIAEPEQADMTAKALDAWSQGGEGHWSDDDLTLGKLRARKPDERKRQQQRERLQRPDGSDPDLFYRQVAHAYSEYAATARGPAKQLAAESGVPVTTVHRWVREARRRGFLAPAAKGRAG